MDRSVLSISFETPQCELTHLREPFLWLFPRTFGQCPSVSAEAPWEADTVTGLDVHDNHHRECWRELTGRGGRRKGKTALKAWCGSDTCRRTVTVDRGGDMQTTVWLPECVRCRGLWAEDAHQRSPAPGRRGLGQSSPRTVRPCSGHPWAPQRCGGWTLSGRRSPTPLLAASLLKRGQVTHKNNNSYFILYATLC